MAWDHDLGPIEYLEQRIRYYKKKRAIFKRDRFLDYVNRKYGDDAERVIENAKARVENRIIEYQNAVEILKQVIE